MKQIFFLAAVIATGYLCFAYFGTRSNHKLEYSKPVVETPLRVVYFQDITSSIKSHGIEIVNSQHFRPFYVNVHRTIELNYGVISSSSARPLITVHLPAFIIRKPIKPNFADGSISDKAELSKEYESALKKYRSDSSIYYTYRNTQIDIFKSRVDSLTTALRTSSEVGGTDIVTAIDIADKCFNSKGDYSNYLVLNTDGLDNRGSSRPKLTNKVSVVAISAGRKQSTSLDSLYPKTFQASEQAIQLILNQ